MMKKHMQETSGSCIPNGNFSAGNLDGLPERWKIKSPRPSLAPVFKLVKKDGRKVLLAAGNGREDCVEHMTASVRLRGGRTYRLRVRFQMSRDLNPHKRLLYEEIQREVERWWEQDE